MKIKRAKDDIHIKKKDFDRNCKVQRKKKERKEYFERYMKYTQGGKR